MILSKQTLQVCSEILANVRMNPADPNANDSWNKVRVAQTEIGEQLKIIKTASNVRSNKKKNKKKGG